MIEIERLRIADFYAWLGCQNAAAAELGCNQSTVSRRAREAASLADATSRIDQADFLQLERQVHQCWRFSRGCDLRLHAYRWTNHLLRARLPEPWRLNPIEVSVTPSSPLQLLEDHVIDALLAPWPVVAELDPQRFALVPVYFTPLVLLTSSAAPLALERGLSHRDIASLSTLGRLEFVPQVAADCSHHLDQQMFGTSPSGPSQGGSAARIQDGARPQRYWGTPLTPLIRPDLTSLPYATPVTYSEFLVCLREWQDHAEIDHLLSAVRRLLMVVGRHQPGLETLALA
jgi:hypothetical protein